jgi:hypothetical protein
MKRSEMLQKINMYFRDMMRASEYPNAEHVLLIIEEAGMLPPLNKWEDYLWEPEEHEVREIYNED